MSACYMGFPVSFKRTEEEREDPPAKRRELEEKELKEDHALIREHLGNFGHGSLFFSWAEEDREAAKRREIRKFLEEHNALMGKYLCDIILSSLTIPFTMGGAGSTNERAEEEKKREAAKRREIREKELKEHNALMWEHLWPYELEPHIPSWKHLLNCEHGSFIFSRAEEEKKREAAKRRELEEKELNEEHKALIRKYLCDIILRDEEKREAAKRREIREKELKEYKALMREDLSDFLLRDDVLDLSLRAEEEEREAAKRRELMKLLEENNALMGAEEKKREAAPAMDPEIMELKLLEEQFAFKQEDFWSREPDPFFFPSFGSSLEEDRTVSPALSCDSAQSDDSMNYPMAF